MIWCKHFPSNPLSQLLISFLVFLILHAYIERTKRTIQLVDFQFHVGLQDYRLSDIWPGCTKWWMLGRLASIFIGGTYFMYTYSNPLTLSSNFLHIYYEHIEDVHVTFWKCLDISLKIYRLYSWTNWLISSMFWIDSSHIV
jgi:hypothetical protein